MQEHVYAGVMSAVRNTTAPAYSFPAKLKQLRTEQTGPAPSRLIPQVTAVQKAASPLRVMLSKFQDQKSKVQAGGQDLSAGPVRRPIPQPLGSLGKPVPHPLGTSNPLFTLLQPLGNLNRPLRQPVGKPKPEDGLLGMQAGKDKKRAESPSVQNDSGSSSADDHSSNSNSDQDSDYHDSPEKVVCAGPKRKEVCKPNSGDAYTKTGKAPPKPAPANKASLQLHSVKPSAAKPCKPDTGGAEPGKHASKAVAGIRADGQRPVVSAPEQDSDQDAAAQNELDLEAKCVKEEKEAADDVPKPVSREPAHLLSHDSTVGRESIPISKHPGGQEDVGLMHIPDACLLSENRLVGGRLMQQSCRFS